MMMPFIVEIPFLYDAKVVPPRKRNIRDIKVMDRIPVIIQEKTEDSFPIAIQFVSGNSSFNAHNPKLVSKNPVDFRWDGQNLYGTIGGHFSNIEELKALLQDIKDEEDVERSPFHQVQGFKKYHRRHYDSDPILAQHIDGKVESDNRRERVADLLKIAGQMFVFNGYLWTHTSEPCWSSRRGSGAEAVQLSDWCLQNNKVYRADDLDLYENEVRRTNRDQEEFHIEVKGRIDILIPEAVKFRPSEMYFIKEANHFLESTGGWLKDAQVEFLIAYAGLRDILIKNETMPHDELACMIEPFVIDIPIYKNVKDEEEYQYLTKSLMKALNDWQIERKRHPHFHIEHHMPPSRTL
jgi:hypothetical protein